MSAVDVSADTTPTTPAGTGAEAAPYRAPVRSAWRFYLSELRLVFGRRRNQVILAVLASVPIVIAIAVKLAAPEPGEGPPFLTEITNSGLFVAFTALTVALPLFLPLAVAVVAGDSVAGEANTGSLRYLLTVPAGRTRLLGIKFAGVATYCLAAAGIVALTGVVIGLVLYPVDDILLLSGTSASFAEGLGRLLLTTLYVSACLISLGAVGLFVSTLTEVPVAATAATAVIAVGSQVLDAVPQLSFLDDYLISHDWMSYGDLLRDPIATDGLTGGLVTAAGYLLVFGSLAWWRFSTKDVTC
jgi:ABC-2 type transport system permease protein